MQRDVQMLAEEQRLVCENRERLEVTGVREVLAFDEESVTASTVMGELTISGEGLRLDRLSLDTGELSVRGRIDSAEFSDRGTRGGFLARLFG